MNERDFLEKIQKKEISIEQGIEILKKIPYEDIKFAKLDHHRKLRRGAGEVIFCQGKDKHHLLEIYRSFSQKGEDLLGTRATLEQYEYLKKYIKGLEFDPTSSILKIHHKPLEQKGCIVVATGGTSDIPIAEEAAQTAEYFGTRVKRLYDVGVAGIHRLLQNLDVLEEANAIVAVAGMEGALASVIGGLSKVPVIALPTSVGYGASFQGVAALLSMLNSCSEGVTVVNIDNGFGAGYSAAQINNLVIGQLNK